ncbi:uncharacterized protein EDB91DRAFT_1158122 [Suillus paluster]|uniref:uncharacterized protein n=1 Tax=Suillus paluster TaxID=48578 RepID=UPI001B862A82|nr:uncharacterized protein EDB91DRAFT_1158122 [Suillus paluster]KAG1730151.1 hypothetical protein EDB91DRAFT_1158122 [Suillus paluster]
MVAVASLACLLFSPVQNLDSISGVLYRLLILLPLLLSVMGLSYQRDLKLCCANIEKYYDQEGLKPRLKRDDVLYHISLFPATQVLLAYSLACLAGGLCMIVMGVNVFTSLAVVITVGIHLDAAFTEREAGDLTFLAGWIA